MKINHLVNILLNDISYHSILKLVMQITQYHRIQGSKGYLNASHYIQSILNENGEISTLHQYPADEKWENWSWITPISWDIKSGECWITKPITKKLCTFKDIPMSVLTHSKSADFEAELVDVEKGDKIDDYKSAKEKIAMITASPRKVFSFAAQEGVKGLILNPDLERAAKIGDDTTQYDGFWPIAENLSDVTLGFSISHRQARELREYLESEKDVRLQFKIDADFSTEVGKLHVLETVITGSDYPEEEVVIISHLCHPSPSANDNASGSGALVELFLSLGRMINSGKLPQPKRTMRFLWVPEFSGTIPWLKQFDDQRKINGRRILAVFNLDIIGESPVKIGTPLKISSPSIRTPSYLQTLLKHACECITNQKVESTNGHYHQFNFRMAPFEGGSDHIIFNDQYFSIPSVMLGHEDPFHHSTVDNVDKVDPIDCRNVIAATGSIAYGIAVSDDEFLKEILVYEFLEGIEKGLRHELSLKQNQEFTEIQKLRQTELLEKLIIQRMERILELDSDGRFKDELEYYSELVKVHFSRLLKSLGLYSKGKKREEIGKQKVNRNYSGPTSYKLLNRIDRSEQNQKKYLALIKDHWGGVVLEFFNLTDGKTSVDDIFLLLQTQYPIITYEDVLFLIKLFYEEELLNIPDSAKIFFE
ncbi:MAG: DUF4910 domain-containing protein [Candidatus Hodarchaeota archaeon]